MSLDVEDKNIYVRGVDGLICALYLRVNLLSVFGYLGLLGAVGKLVGGVEGRVRR